MQQIIKRIEKEMKKNGIAPSQYSLQIEQTAKAIHQNEQMQRTVQEQGMVIEEMSTKGDVKHVAHPLLTTINQFHRTITQQLTALGLNRLKVAEAPTNKKNDPMAEMMKALK